MRRRPSKASASANMPQTTSLFFAATPPALATTTATSYLQKTRVLKPTTRRESAAARSNQTSHLDTNEADTCVREKLAFDQLLRMQRSRAEDVTKLVNALGNLARKEWEKERMAAKFREEWRTNREEEIYMGLDDDTSRIGDDLKTQDSSENLRAYIRIQSIIRCIKPRRIRKYLEGLRSIRAKRSKMKKWKSWHGVCERTSVVNIHLAEWSCHMSIESTRAAKEIRREEARFTAEWSRYESRLEKDVLRSKLPPEWIPQLDPVSGETFYLNIQATKTSKEHPNVGLFHRLAKKQKIRAENQYTDRRARLETYQAHLEAERVSTLAAMLDQLSVSND
ncbi:hypothetical protein Poli38472_011363 [Pythium oligandrum]|uniref:WW domain-containing protein n=1 Tax=Pythium oligandrum TaxID=41045 RepID=A0A8K1FNB4_PYTOL|nr:hypothetical protein Poli38472_011363 [Pythium oligandrum]|eukprot:TMW64483.1 hypothetical protein Poli38472_011363 [Pythium oligandrum]